MPLWGIFGAFALLVVLGIGTMLAMPAQSTADPSRQPRPIPTFTFAEQGSERTFALFLGDSYSAGARASSEGARWTTLVSNELGWDEINRAYSGTGYLTSREAGIPVCGFEYCPSYAEVVSEAGDLTPDLVVLSGGRNDGGSTPQHYDSVVATISAVQAQWPGVDVVVTSLLWDDDPIPPAVQATADDIREAALASGARYLELGQPLEGRVDFIDGDGVHPNDAGYRAIADSFLAAWR